MSTNEGQQRDDLTLPTFARCRLEDLESETNVLRDAYMATH